MIHHIVVGEEAATSLQQAAETQEELQGRVWVLEDRLSVGPLHKGEAEGFTARRQQYWTAILGKEAEPIPDMEKVLELSARMFREPEDEAWFWLSDSADDVAAYLWSLPYLSKHLGRYRVLAYSRLPFLNGEGKVFYPRHIGELGVGELVKARKLAILLTSSEAEFDIDHWSQIQEQGGLLRKWAGGRKLVEVEENHYDSSLIDTLPSKWTRGSRWIPLLQAQFSLPLPFLIRRLKRAVEEGKAAWRGTWDKEIKDWEVCRPLPNETAQDLENSPNP